MSKKIALLKSKLKKVIRLLKTYENKAITNDTILNVHNLFNEKIALQRELGLAQGAETAVLFDYPYPWDIGAPLPHVASSEDKVFLMYYFDTHNPAKNKLWNTQPFEITNLNTGHDDLTVLVEFKNCYIYKFGGVNDEAISGHPLYEYGLEAYKAHIIHNSSWLQEQIKTNAVHPSFNQDLWNEYNHYFFAFHDEIFECLAEGYCVDVFRGRIESVYEVATARIFGRPSINGYGLL